MNVDIVKKEILLEYLQSYLANHKDICEKYENKFKGNEKIAEFLRVLDKQQIEMCKKSIEILQDEIKSEKDFEYSISKAMHKAKANVKLGKSFWHSPI
ncbi:hypothetical protein DCO58_11730 [Helicobacter saguini]|uniref:HPt domain-containing protein n=1 Tax=Helicobacter saguini TaxID=1548018 RepID=A0A347VQ82_9HELI|nr:hypothetical protein [Helicobacter saguini]MWV61040.1 hypothetical protein [Helicobacter saguini]MWV68291.1 hypothetical protein [Helicobacter saguini]MWV70244.1 hypothetical protein [Helicobacter saguini]MWV72147.1 hypothetical protein [Helicobacter saguini]TLD95209.1 hypothetical protein LS64_002260 [Helicobacter saguini]